MNSLSTDGNQPSGWQVVPVAGCGTPHATLAVDANNTVYVKSNSAAAGGATAVKAFSGSRGILVSEYTFSNSPPGLTLDSPMVVVPP